MNKLINERSYCCGEAVRLIKEDGFTEKYCNNCNLEIFD